ncbi:MAG TPA: hypothetical protein DHV62_07445 [Elusimicrobia bacterium]|nr:hypothetical protein [Elusimicrobiota bacterium]
MYFFSKIQYLMRTTRTGEIQRQSFLVQTIILFLFWLAISFPPDFATPIGFLNLIQHVIVGLVLAVLVSSLFPQSIIPPEELYLLKPSNLFRIFLYSIRLTWDILLAGIDVANRVLRINMRISPAIVQVKSPLPDALQNTINANSITLTPGTITIDVEKTAEGYIFTVHCISQENAESILKDAGFVKRIQKVFRWFF